MRDLVIRVSHLIDFCFLLGVRGEKNLPPKGNYPLRKDVKRYQGARGGGYYDDLYAGPALSEICAVGLGEPPKKVGGQDRGNSATLASKEEGGCRTHKTK